jgi:hypothetical protein
MTDDPDIERGLVGVLAHEFDAIAQTNRDLAASFRAERRGELSLTHSIRAAAFEEAARLCRTVRFMVSPPAPPG